MSRKSRVMGLLVIIGILSIIVNLGVAGEKEEAVKSRILTGWGGGKPEEVVPKAAELGFKELVVHHDNAANFKKFIKLGKKYGIDIYAWMFLGDVKAWKKFNPGIKPPLQVMRPEEEKAWERIKADKTPDKSGYQWGGEPLKGLEVLQTPLLCFHDPRVIEMFKKQMDEMLAFPGVKGIAFDYVGYRNYHDCLCPVSQAKLKAYRNKHPELSEKEASQQFALETLVDFNNQLAAYVRKVKPDAKVITHVYPVYLPEPLYGNRLDLDVCCQTAAWFFKPFWSLEKIRKYSRIIAEDANRYYPRPKGAGLIGVGGAPHKKTKERLAKELQAILDGGCSRIHVCSLNKVLKNPETATVFKEFFGKKNQSGKKGGLPPAKALKQLSVAEVDTSKVAPSLMPEWQRFKTVPILSYQWPKNKDEKMRLERFQDYLEMGFTGIYKLDKEPSYAGKLFLDKGMHGFMFQTRFHNRKRPVLDRDGKPAWFRKHRDKHPYCKSIFSPENAKFYYDWTTDFVKKYGPENMFTVGDTLVMSSWDETGLYSREAIEYGYTAKEEFIDYLKNVVFKDKTPGDDSSRDKQTFNHTTGLSLTDWKDVTMPVIAERYQRSGLWRLWIDFHGYYTNLFFLRGGQVIGKGIKRDVELFPFLHATVKWPGASSIKGLDLYGASQMHRLLTVEDCQADYPGSTIHYSFTDQLSRRYKRPVAGWSWFFPSKERQNDPLGAGRALARAMGHNVHGLLFWIYHVAWKEKPEMRAVVAYWHRLFQAHWDFLKNATVPKPQVAVLFPRNTGNMYIGYEYPKLDYGWTIQALSEAHVPFEVIADNQVESEPEILNDYMVLIIPTAAWESPSFLNAVESFIGKGGFVYTNADSLMINNNTGLTIPFLMRFFGIKPLRKYKGLFAPTYDSMPEYKWSKEHASKWQTPKWEKGSHGYLPDILDRCTPLTINDNALESLREKLPRKSGTGLPQSLIDPRRPQWIISETVSNNLPRKHRTFHDIITGEIQPRAKVLARYGTEVCAVETPQTIWTGFRPGFDHACVFPLPEMRKWGEPIWPFAKNLSTNAAGRNSSREWITRIINKAGVKPLITITQNGKRCPEIEILVRKDKQGNALIFLINHEKKSGEYLLEGELLKSPRIVGNLMNGKTGSDTDGKMKLLIPAEQVIMLASGDRDFVNKRIKAHMQVSKKVKDMVVFE